MKPLLTLAFLVFLFIPLDMVSGPYPAVSLSFNSYTPSGVFLLQPTFYFTPERKKNRTFHPSVPALNAWSFEHYSVKFLQIGVSYSPQLSDIRYKVSLIELDHLIGVSISYGCDPDDGGCREEGYPKSMMISVLDFTTSGIFDREFTYGKFGYGAGKRIFSIEEVDVIPYIIPYAAIKSFRLGERNFPSIVASEKSTTYTGFQVGAEARLALCQLFKGTLIASAASDYTISSHSLGQIKAGIRGSWELGAGLSVEATVDVSTVYFEHQQQRSTTAQVSLAKVF